MRLVPREIDKLVIQQAGALAQSRLARGRQLNGTEATALIASVTLELIRDGEATVADLMARGRTILGKRQVLPAVPHLLHEVQVEGLFPDGTKLVTIHNPIAREHGDLALALLGTAFAPPSLDAFPPLVELEPFQIPGAYQTLDTPIVLNPGRPRVVLSVTNDGDRPVQIGSHYHFVEVNPFLVFDRALAYGKRLDIPAGTAVRFEPGDSKHVTLVDIAGSRVITGGNGVATGQVDASKIPGIVRKLLQKGFRHVPQAKPLEEPVPYQLSRHRYAALYGPTTGDRVRLGDTELIVEIERDYTHYGDECVFGGGKVIRDGMGQQSGVSQKDALDLVITNAIVIDYTGIYKADIGIKDHLIAGIGKAGNPDMMSSITPKMVIGPTTEVLAGEGHIFTAGAIDCHVHFICPGICTEALSSGITTLIGGGTGPNTGTNATTCTPGAVHLKMMIQATDDLPLNFGFTGKGNSSSPIGLVEQIHGGAIGLKLHEDWGSTPAAIDACLTVCDKFDVQTTIHTDTLNESGFVETTLDAFKDRTIHAYHTEGAGGGHSPDILTVVSKPNVIPSSTNPTRPYTVNTLDEHLDMLMVCHHLDKRVPEDIAFAESRIRGETIGAEDILHDLGAISIISSDSQAMGRVGEVIARTWQTADKMKQVRGHLPLPGAKSGAELQRKPHDNFRARRYIAKYTINPALAHGVSHIVGSIEVGKLADLVMFKPDLFGTKPELVLKGGNVAWSMMGDANASIPTPQPVLGRLMFGGRPGGLRDGSCRTFVSKVSLPTVGSWNLAKTPEAVRNCRNIGKADMKLNDQVPQVLVHPETYQVHVDGKLVSMAPSSKVSLSSSTYLY